MNNNDRNESKGISNSKLRFTSSAQTHVGNKREINEDAVMDNPTEAHWAVADGMGGHAAGDMASKLLINTLFHVRQLQSFANTVDDLEVCIKAVNRTLLNLTEHSQDLIGTTLAGVLIRETCAFYYWVGDSRVYLWRNNKLIQLTKDHTFVQELVDDGVISPEEALYHPKRNVVTRAVGTEQDLCIDMDCIEIVSGDIFIVSSDGLDKELTPNDITLLTDQYKNSPETLAQKLIDSTLAGVAADNVSVVVVGAFSEEFTQAHSVNESDSTISMARYEDLSFRLKNLCTEKLNSTITLKQYICTRNDILNELIERVSS